MTLVEWMVVSAWAQMCAVWALLLWAQRRALILTPAAPSCAEAEPRVTVVIPVCNERATIDRCLASVAAQHGVRLRVVVVDDRSEDGTAEMVAAWARRDPRFRLISIERLTPGWLGKSHALWHATRDLTSDWLLFLDADCRLLSPDAVVTAWRHAHHTNTDLLTLWPRHDAGGHAEAALIPLCAAVMALWFGRSNQPSAAAFANGQFLLVRRSVYETIDGHRAVRRALIEDVPMAQVLRAAGYRTFAAGGRDLVAVRMYDRGSAVFKGWSRIFIGALRSPWKILLSMLWLLAGSAWPFVAGIYLAWSWFHLGVDAPLVLWWMSGLCVTHLALLMLVSLGFWGMGGCDRRYLWVYPASVAGVLAILGHAFWNLSVRRSVQWRTTRYRIDRTAVILGDS
jgi:chlorobactene glucosyltransferase